MATGLNYSPIHLASTQGLGAFGLHIEEDGGLVSSARMDVGFGRRNIEGISLQLPLAQALNYADRLDCFSAPAYNFALATAFESLLGLEVPERAQFTRLVLLELNRISSHLHFYANLARVAGQQPLTNHCLREREKFSDIFEMYCGSRLGFGAISLGGVFADATDGWFFRIEKAITSLKEFVPDLRGTLLEHPFFTERARGLGMISKETAERANLLGPNGRASGRDGIDERSVRPYSAYPACAGDAAAIPGAVTPGIDVQRTQGDVLARSAIRVDEMLGSASLIENCFRKIPGGNHRIRVGMDVAPPP
ncbi:MAG: hypothetical protein EOP11_22170, partial [Proteobacteria bacterium]